MKVLYRTDGDACCTPSSGDQTLPEPLRGFGLFQAKGPGGGGFNRAFVDEFVGSLACRWPGVRQVTVHDSAQAGEYVAGLTRALAEQPFRVEVRS